MFNIEKIKNKIYHNLICKFTIEKRKPFHLHTKSSVQLSHRLQTISTLSSTSKKKNKTIVISVNFERDAKRAITSLFNPFIFCFC